MNTVAAKRILETALICTPQPLQLRDMRVLFDDRLGLDTLKVLLRELQQDWAQGGGLNWSTWQVGGVFKVDLKCGNSSTVCTLKSRRVTPAPRWKHWPSLRIGNRSLAAI